MLQNSSDQSDRSQGSTSRRDFLRRTLASATLMTSGAWMQAPALISGEKPSVKMLSWNNFTPEAEAELRRQAEDYSRRTGVQVTVDLIPRIQLLSRTAVEAQSESGHDIIFFFRSQEMALYQNSLIDLTDIVVQFKNINGGYYPWIKDELKSNGAWPAIPWFTGGGFLGCYNETVFRTYGQPVPDTWEDVKNAGRQLKRRGYPAGVAISRCDDANATFWHILWCYGGKVLEPDGKTVAIKSAATKQVLEFYKELYTDAMEPDVLSWDNISNNRYLITGKGAWIHNPISAYNTAKSRNLPIAHDLNHHLTPRGPAGRFMAASAQLLGIWKFAKHPQHAKNFISFIFQEENLHRWMDAAGGNQIGPQRGFARHPVFSRDPKIAISPTQLDFGRPYGWPARPSAVVGEIDVTYVLPDMVAKVVSGTPIHEAITWCEEQLNKIVKSQRT